MKKENILETKLRNLTFIVIFGFIVLGLLVIGLYFKKGTVSDSTTSTQKNQGTTTTTYDVSKMKQVNGAQAAALFEEKGTHFLYIGRSTCSVCVSLVPELNTVLNDMTLTINYLPLGDNFRTEFEPLYSHLDIETTVNSNKGTFGELLEKYGYTPIVIIIKDGKMVDGFVGYRESNTIETLFKKYM